MQNGGLSHEGLVQAAVHGDNLAGGLAQALAHKEEIRLGLVGRRDRALGEGAVGIWNWASLVTRLSVASSSV
jgi:hypothetical protein